MRTPRLTELLDENPAFAKVMANNKNALRSFLFQIQLDSTTEENRDTVGPTILALRDVHRVFEDIILRGEILIEKENQKKKQ